MLRKGFTAAGSLAPVLGHDEIPTAAHSERLDIVASLLIDSGATTALDLGCGSGALLRRLITSRQFRSLVGLDSSPAALQLARQIIMSENGANHSGLTLVQGSLLSCKQNFAGFDAVTMVETIEHIAPTHLSIVEHTVFHVWRPGMVVITTPNQEYNTLLGLAEAEFRHPDHQFEWSRSKFRSWASGIARRQGYCVTFEELGPIDCEFGSPTQMGVFRRKVEVQLPDFP